MSSGPASATPASATPASVVVVGASLAGLSAVRALREHGFTGRITVVGDEKHRPYDRPPLSKSFLMPGASDPFLMSDDEDPGAEFLLGRSAVGMGSRSEPSSHVIDLDEGSHVVADVAINATGARARTLLGAEHMTGVHTLRTLDDAMALRRSLDTATRLVVVGAGFIGAEVASTAAARGLEVTVVEASTVPLSGPLGLNMAAVVTRMHARHGVTLLAGASVDTLQEGSDGAIRSVLLGDGTVLPADVVVIGIGAIPNTEWAAASGLAIDGGFVTDSRCSTTVPGVFAIGDCARSFDDVLQDHHRSEHWSNATTQAQVVARTILDLPPADRPATPYFWSDQYGTRLQFAGRRQATDDVRIVDGDADGPFVAVYERGGVMVGVLARDNPRHFTKLRRQLGVR